MNSLATANTSLSEMSPSRLEGENILNVDFHFPIGACFLIGGSGFSVGVVNHDGQTVASSRSIPWREIGVVPGHTLTNDQVTEALFTRLFAVTRELTGKEEHRLALVGVSFAGPLTGSGDDIMAHGTNMGVKFERPLKEYLIQYADRAGFSGISRADITVINDGAAGAFGELYAENGVAFGTRDLIYLILGTGVGGARVVNNQLDASFTEAGHTLLRSPDGEYSLCPLAELESRGLFRDGQFITPDDGTSYFEHRVGGPWVAVRFAKYLAEISDAALDQIALVRRPEGCPDFNRQDIEKVAALREEDVADWNRLVDKNTEKALNMLLRYHAQSSRNATTFEFPHLAYQFETLLYAEIGSALRVLSEAYPDAEIVLGSSLAEVRGESVAFLDMLYSSTNGRAYASQIASGTEREAAALTLKLKAIAAREQSD